MTARRIHGHFLFETGSFPIHAQVQGLSLRGSVEVRNDHVECPHLDSDTSRKERQEREKH